MRAPPMHAVQRSTCRVSVTPRASQDQVGPWDGQVLRVRLKAPPVEGAANKALIVVLARALGRPKSTIRIKAGQGSRMKVVEFDGLSAEQLIEQLGRFGGTQSPYGLVDGLR